MSGLFASSELILFRPSAAVMEAAFDVDATVNEFVIIDGVDGTVNAPAPSAGAVFAVHVQHNGAAGADVNILFGADVLETNLAAFNLVVPAGSAGTAAFVASGANWYLLHYSVVAFGA